ncbi:MAG TPA: hypothetical protein VGR22_07755, partial [Thermomicrobiales bacterium]|nr:hypothetical protein [Thermomicrobiales bacterium]
MQPSVVAVITEETQNDIVAALHAARVGHLTRVIRRERGAIAAQLGRAGIDTAELPAAIDAADRTVLISPASHALETACLVLQRGAVSAWTLTNDDGWQPIDDKAIEITATRGFPARPVAPAHRSGRTFRKPNVHRRPRRDIVTPPTSA